MMQVALFGKLIIFFKIELYVTLLLVNDISEFKEKRNFSIKMNNFIPLVSMQGCELKPYLLKARFNIAAFSLKVSCCVISL